MSANTFTGLSMPVFSAFGWAGEEAALEFALSQLELFIDTIYFQLPRGVQTLFPHRGLDRAGQLAYLATNEETQSGLVISFLARPMSLEINLSVADKSALSTAYRFAEKQPATLHEIFSKLGAEWHLQVQQLEHDPESDEPTDNPDLFKDNLDKLDDSGIIDLIARASFYNDDEKWVTPVTVRKRFDSEKIAFMRTKVLAMAISELEALAPLVAFLTGQKRKVKKATEKTVAKKEVIIKRIVEETSRKELVDAAGLDEFTFVSDLKPLHIRRGFINLTPFHWPFFAINARTETRPVTLSFADKSDDQCAVWRLVPNDQARLVLSVPVQRWVDDNFQAGDEIEVIATKSNGGEIAISLKSLS